jgi:hypothetical protein
VEIRGLEPLTSCMRSNNPELLKLLNFLEAVEFIKYPISRSLPIFAGFGTFWKKSPRKEKYTWRCLCFFYAKIAIRGYSK